MKEDKGETDVLKVYMTAKGSHERDKTNVRQIDEIKLHILPELASDDVGIITPYKNQTIAVKDILNKENDISTVHKFQGREKDDIILTTVDNVITKFTEDPNILNVAVSRAKNRLRLVVSNNEKNDKTNIGDLIRYIKYNNFEVIHSDIHSIFDMLYKEYQSQRQKYLKIRKKVSTYDSENLMYVLIKDVLDESEFSHLSVTLHIPLYTLIKDFSKLEGREKNYAQNHFTHVDFIIFNSMDKSPLLAIEVDGYAYHKLGSLQKERDELKNSVLEKYNIPLLRFATTDSGEYEKLVHQLRQLL